MYPNGLELSVTDLQGLTPKEVKKFRGIRGPYNEIVSHKIRRLGILVECDWLFIAR